MATSYSHAAGSGYRPYIVATKSAGLGFNGTVYALINGTTANEAWFANTAVADEWLKWDFRSRVIIDEAKWYQDNATTHGTWKFQGSNNDSDWTDIGSSFTLGGNPQTITEINGNTTAYRYYRILGISGTTSSSPYTQEIEFKADGDTAETTSYYFTGGVGDRTSTITVTDSGICNQGVNSNFVDGAFGANSTDSRDFNTGVDVSDDWIKFDFGAGNAKKITEALWYQSVTGTHGIWKWQGSNNDADWTDIGSSFTLGTIDVTTLELTQVQTTLAGNTTGYRYYRLAGVSGTSNGLPWLKEANFNLAAVDAAGFVVSVINNPLTL